MEPMNSMNVEQNNKYECVFKRGGLCKTHGVMGRRNVKSKQVWKRKKDGTYGWITSKKVEYECEGLSNQMQPVSQSSGSVNIIPEPGIAQIMGDGCTQELGLSDGLVGRDTRSGDNTDESESLRPSDGIG